MKRALLTIACLCLAVITARTVARPEAGQLEASLDLPDKQDTVIIRAYDIRQLVRIASEKDPDPEAHGDLFGAAVAAPNQIELNTVSQIESLLVDQIDTVSWYSNGGMQGELRYSDGLLVIRQTGPNQAKAAALLDKLHRIITRPQAAKSSLLE